MLIKVADVKSILPGSAIKVESGRDKIALFNVGGIYYAIGDTCTHRGGPFSEGRVEGTQVVCPWHGARYDLATGKVLRPPAVKGVASYKVIAQGNDVMIELP